MAFTNLSIFYLRVGAENILRVTCLLKPCFHEYFFVRNLAAKTTSQYMWYQSISDFFIDIN